MTITQAESGCRKRLQTMIADVWHMKRDLVSDGFDAALKRLGREMPMTVHQYPTGKEAWTWIIPNKWTCHEAYVETLDGRRLFDYKDSPLHCASYSCSFEGVISRAELFRHLKTHEIKDAVPWGWRFYRKDWQLCCSEETKAAMTDDRYKVVVRTESAPGKLKVGEITLKGESDREFVLCAHLDHPYQVNDDLSGVVVGIEVMRALARLKKRRYTYRLLLTPETIGSLCWLSSHEKLIPKIDGGLFLEMLGTDCAHSLQMSYQKESEMDLCLREALMERESDAWSAPFRQVIGNDERQFNAPGVRVPMLSLSRVFQPKTGKWPYPEYHSSKDTPEFISLERLEASVDTTLAMLARIEENLYPINLFRGEVFCTRYNLFVDFYENPEGNRRLFETMQMIDGTKSLSQIARAARVPYPVVLKVAQDLERNGLVRLSGKPGSYSPTKSVLKSRRK